MKLIFLGSQALADGFSLLGFETFPEADVNTMETVLADLLKTKSKALVFLETSLSEQPSAIFTKIRQESASIIMTESPPLNAPETYHPLVEDLVIRVSGTSALDKPL